MSCDFVFFFFSEWKGIVYSKFVTWPRAIYPSTHTNSRFMQRLTQQTWQRKTWEDAGGEDNGSVIFSFTGNDAERRKREKRKARRET